MPLFSRCQHNGTWTKVFGCQGPKEQSTKGNTSCLFFFLRHSHARAIPFESIGCCTSLTLSLLDNDFDFLYMYGSFLGIWLQVHSFTQNTRFLQYATYRSPWYNRMGKSTTSQCIEKLGTKISSWPTQTCCMKAIRCPGPCGEVLRQGRGTTLET